MKRQYWNRRRQEVEHYYCTMCQIVVSEREFLNGKCERCGNEVRPTKARDIPGRPIGRRR